MANRFSIWIDTPITGGSSPNTQTYSAFASDTQRGNGFAAGNAASAIRVNSALRQANLVAVALMNNIIEDTSTLDLNSTLADVTAAIAAKFATMTPPTLDDVPTSGSNNGVKSGGVYNAIQAEVTARGNAITALQEVVNGKQAQLTFDTTPTTDSTNPVTSGGIKLAIDAKSEVAGQSTIPTGTTNEMKALTINGVNWKIAQTLYVVSNTAPDATTSGSIFWVDTGTISGKSILKYNTGTGWQAINSIYG